MAKFKVLGIALVCALCVAVSGVLAGCGGPQTPTQVADAYLKDMKSTSTAEALSVLGNDQDMIDAMYGKEFSEILVKKLVDFDYKIGNEKIDGDNASVEVTITTYNLGNAFTNFFRAYMQQVVQLALSGDASEDDIMDIGIALITEEVNKTSKDYTATVPLYLIKQNNQWVVDEDYANNIEFINALTGGLFAAYEQIATQYASLLGY